MQINLTADELKVVGKILSDKDMKARLFSCKECRYFHQHYVKSDRGILAAPSFTETNCGHCTAKKIKSMKSEGRPCPDFKLRGLEEAEDESEADKTA